VVLRRAGWVFGVSSWSMLGSFRVVTRAYYGASRNALHERFGPRGSRKDLTNGCEFFVNSRTRPGAARGLRRDSSSMLYPRREYGSPCSRRAREGHFPVLDGGTDRADHAARTRAT